MKKPTPRNDSADPRLDLAQLLYEKIQRVKRDHPVVSKEIDDIEEEIRNSMRDLKTEMSRVRGDEEKSLLTILLIHEVHRSVEGVLTGGHGPGK